MNLGKYQELAMKTCMPSSENFGYMMLNLVGEVGELASKVAKAIQKGEAKVDKNTLYLNLRNEPESVKNFEEMRKKAGDILWQLSGLCNIMGWNLEDVARENLKKLADRQQRNVIDGNGDNR